MSTGQPPPPASQGEGGTLGSHRPRSLYRRAAVSHLAHRQKEVVSAVYETRRGSARTVIILGGLALLFWLTWLRPVPLMVEVTATRTATADGAEPAWQLSVPRLHRAKLDLTGQTPAQALHGSLSFPLVIARVVEGPEPGRVVARVHHHEGLDRACPPGREPCSIRIQLGFTSLLRSFRETSALMRN
jgi:hypothetical protein